MDKFLVKKNSLSICATNDLKGSEIILPETSQFFPELPCPTNTSFHTENNMLNKAERYQVLQTLRIYSIVGLLPIQVDLESWQLKAPSKGKKFLSVLSGTLCTLHALYKIGSLAYTYFFVPNVQLHQLIIHGILALASAMYIFWFYTLYIYSPSQFAAYVNITLVGNVGGIMDRTDELKTDRKTRLREYSMQDLIATSLPFIVLLAEVVVIAAYIYDPSMRLLLYAALPTGLQSWTTFGLCLMEEVRLLLIYITTFVPVWQLQVISYDLLSKKLNILKRAVQTGRKSGRSVYRLLRCLQLYVSLLNEINSFLIFTWKLVGITLSIISGYAAIAHFSVYPIFGMMYYVLFFDMVLIYTLIYDKAFNIPELFGQVTSCCLLHSMREGIRDKVLTRQIRSISRTGIKVGNFHKMERESTMIFMDYVVKNIVNMLVAYG